MKAHCWPGFPVSRQLSAGKGFVASKWMRAANGNLTRLDAGQGRSWGHNDLWLVNARTNVQPLQPLNVQVTCWGERAKRQLT